MGYNNITGDSISTRFGTKEQQEKFDEAFDNIFGTKAKKTNGGWKPPPLPTQAKDDWDETRIDRIGSNGDGFPDKSHYD